MSRRVFGCKPYSIPSRNIDNSRALSGDDRPRPRGGGRRRRTKVLAIASGGGHWVQLTRLLPAFEGCDIVFATVNASRDPLLDGRRRYDLTDANRHQPLRMLRLALQVFWILLRERPQAVVSTGAAPGLLAVRMSRWFGARAAWIDSIANAEELSLSGQLAGRSADLWLTQWQHLAGRDGPQYRGAVL